MVPDLLKRADFIFRTGARTVTGGMTVLLILFITLAPRGALAQPNSNDPPLDSITVTAPKAADGKPTPFQLGGTRWLFALCPVTVGLTPEENIRVTRRVQHVAAFVGAPVKTSEDCNPNAEIVFTAAPQEFLDAVAEKSYRLLGNINHNQAKEAAKVRYPIQSWYSTAMMDSSGNILLMPPDEGDCDPYCFFNQDGPARVIIETVIIVVDLNRVQGQILDALSDYVSLMALTQARAFPKCQTQPSIANLVADDCSDDMRADGLMPGDIAWLRGLYHMSIEAARQANQKDLAELTPTGAKNGD
jgi:hypothetical protein